MRAPELVARRVEEVLGAARLETFEHPVLAGPRPCARPRDLPELAELLRLAGSEGWRVLPVGGGSKLSWSPPPIRADLVVSTAELRGVVDYEPADGTLTALAGTPMAHLAEVARGGGHRLTPEVARPDTATLGGVVAAGQSGICRLRLGPTRNHVLGLRAVLPGGRASKSGGRLVKNVTGFDLHRLHTGAHGALGVIVEVSLRLFALPGREATLSWTATRLEEALAAAGRVREGRLAPLAVVVEAGLDGRDPRPRVHALLAGRPEGVARDLEQARAALGPGELELREGERAEKLRRRLRDLEPESRGTLSLRIGCRPSHLGRALEKTLEWLRERDLPRALACHPGLATLEVPLGAAGGLTEGEATDLVRDALELRATLAPRARLDLRGAALARPEGPPAGPLGELQRRLRAALDPGGNLASDRFRGGP